MNNAAVIAVYTKGRRSGGVRQWKGVHHVEEGAPWQLGNELLFRVRRARGDIEAVTQELVLDAPYGWLSLTRRKVAEKEQQPRFYSPKILRGVGGGAPGWLYLLDPETRRLDVYATDLSQPDGHGPEAIVSAVFDERGRSQPHQFVAPPPDWQVVEVAEGWDDEPGEGIRQRFSEQVAAWGARTEVPPEALAATLLGAITAALRETLSGDPLYSRFPIDADSRVWALTLSDGRALRYPTRAARRATRALGVSPGDRLQLANEDRDEAELQLGPVELLERLSDADWPEDWPPPRRVLSELLLAVASAKLPKAIYHAEGLQLVRSKVIVEQVRVPLSEVAFSDVRRRDKRARLGDHEQRNTSVDFIWTVLDWLRGFQVRG
ncbi:MAG: hypothetical protein H6740_14255 [Alphaproteobacteria bacterium]|nr:hypothetical protein [Alphaproteobacteria bacterium]